MTDVSRGAPGRVAAVHRQTRRGLLVTVVFLVAAVALGVIRSDRGWWLPLHLFAVGALLSAISTTTQMLAVTWSAAPPPRDRVAATQRWLLVVGAVAVVVGRETDRVALLVVGSALVVGALGGLAAVLWQVRAGAVTPRFHPAIELYVVAAFAGAVGAALGGYLGSGRARSHLPDLRGTHLVLNVYGVVGLVVAATLPYFVATQLRTRMARRATPTALRAVYAALAAAVFVTAAGRLAGLAALAAAGLLVYAAGLVAVVALLPVFGRGRLRWAGVRGVQLLAGIGWWIAMTVALAVTLLRGADDRPVLVALVVGGLAQILVASLAYLGPVLRGGGHERLTAGFALTRSWVSLVAGNVAALAAITDRRTVLGVALAVWLADVVVRAVALAVGRQPAPISSTS